MAEFSEVMRQAARMCRAHEECEECPVNMIADMVPSGCLFGSGIDAGYIEEKIMGWAADNPEPRYPTWKEWQNTNFPNNDALMRPCIFESEEYFGCVKLEIDCEKCMNKPIPADIAEKLGIKPIGGKTDENA